MQSEKKPTLFLPPLIVGCLFDPTVGFVCGGDNVLGLYLSFSAPNLVFSVHPTDPPLLSGHFPAK